jgi:hypothetical protein
MTPEERDLVRGLFDRLSDLERERRDPDAERLIREGQSRAPNAVYSLVQTVLLQDEGLRAADQRIAELEESLEQAQRGSAPSQGGSFLGERRGKWNSGEVLRGSVPQVGGSGDQPMGAPPGFNRDRGGYDEPPRGAGGPWQGGGPSQGGGGPWQAGAQGGPPGGEPPRGGGSFLGTAAAVAAGAIGGGRLMGGIRSALGGHGDSRGPFAGAVDHLGGRSASASGSSGSGSGDLAREAGLNDIGRPSHATSQSTTEEEDADSDADDDSDIDHDEMHDSFEDDEET